MSSLSLCTELLSATRSSLGQSHIALHGGVGGVNIIRALSELEENELL